MGQQGAGFSTLIDSWLTCGRRALAPSSFCQNDGSPGGFAELGVCGVQRKVLGGEQALEAGILHIHLQALLTFLDVC